MQRIGPLKEHVKHLKKVEKDEAGSMSVVQGILLRTDFLRRIISPVGGQGGVTLAYVCPHCNSLPLEDYTWWVSTGKNKSCNWWCVVCGGLYEWRAPSRILVVQIGTNASQAKVFKAHAHGLCENLINALKLLANQVMVIARSRASSKACMRKKRKRNHERLEEVHSAVEA